VLASGRGDEFATDEMIDAIRELLLPHTTIITPNGMEARASPTSTTKTRRPLALCAERLIEMGVANVLITGTHEATADVVNTLYAKTGVVRSDNWARLPAATTDRVARSLRRSQRCSPTDSICPTPCARRRNTHGTRSRKRIGRHGPALARSPVLGTRGSGCAGRSAGNPRATDAHSRIDGRRRAAPHRLPASTH
jgi:hypothetical protein